MNFLLISYRVYEFDGRLRELKRTLEKIGNVYSISLAVDTEIYGTQGEVIKTRSDISPLSIKQYTKFFVKTMSCVCKANKADTIVIQDTPACIPGFFLKILFPKKILIEDVPELKFRKDKHTLYGKIFSLFEEHLIKKADILLCANKQRAEIMKDYYNLPEFPIVHENVRILEEPEYISENCREIVDKINPNKINLINIGGYSVERRTQDLVEAMKSLGHRYDLYIVGGGEAEEKCILEDCIKKNNINNVHLLGRLKNTDLKKVVEICDIGIVNYHKNDLNNYYCASGRVYEYLFAGLPIVTTENLPLKDFCDTYGVGEADDLFGKGISKVARNLDKYRENVNIFIKNISVEKNNDKLVKNLSERIEKIKNNRREESSVY